MRVCVDLTPLEMKDRHGGFGRYAVYLLRELLALVEGMPVELYGVLSSRGPVLPGQAALEASARLAPEIRSLGHRMQRRLFLGPELRKSGVELFHALVPAAQPLRPGCRVVVTAHDLIPLVLPEPELRFHRAKVTARRLVHARRYLLADHVIAISDRTRCDLIAELGVPPERISVVHHGVDLALFHPGWREGEREAARRAHDLPERWLLCVSSDHYRKNHRQLLEAWYRVADRIDEGLVFVGHALYEDTFASMLAEVERRGLSRRFRWLDAVTDAELPALYRGATACVAPSRYEGFGMTLLEAMACGCPVLAAENGAYEEVGGDAARYFALDDTVGLAALIAAVVADAGLRAEMIRRGHERAAAMSWRDTAAATLAVYRRLLAR